MAKKQKTFTEEEIRAKLDVIDQKVDKLVEGYERKITQLERATTVTNVKVKVDSVPMPTDIQVDVNDKLNTQPQNSLAHNYGKNHRMFRRDILKVVMTSKMFWILLVTLPILMTFIEYLLTAWAVQGGKVLGPNAINKTTTDLLNWFMIMPTLLLSLIIFPTFIGVSRENNQLKRYTMLGMSRRQIYWSYMRFTVIFLIIFMFIWMGIWITIMNYSIDSILLTPEQIANGEHVFSSPWGIFFGLDFNYMDGFKKLDANQIVAEGVLKGWGAVLPAGFDKTLFDSDSAITAQNLTSYITSNASGIIDSINANPDLFGFTINDSAKALESLLGATVDGGNVVLDGMIWIQIPTHYEGIKTTAYFVLFALFILGINSVGFNKAMKVKSSRSLMGWGIGLWIFANVVQGSSSLLYQDVYRFNSISKPFWNYFVMFLLFFSKWMFLFSPVTIMIIGVSLTTGLISEPVNGNLMIENINHALDLLKTYPGWIDGHTVVGFSEWMTNALEAYKGTFTETLLAPHTITLIFMYFSGIWAILWTLRVWLFKNRIVSYESAR